MDYLVQKGLRKLQGCDVEDGQANSRIWASVLNDTPKQSKTIPTPKCHKVSKPEKKNSDRGCPNLNAAIYSPNP